MAEVTSEATDESKKPPFCTVGQGSKESVLAFTFGDNSRTVVDIDLDDLDEDISGQLLVHGLTQKGRDSFASAKGDYAFAIGSVQKVFANLRSGQWNASRASGGDGKPKTGELAEAIANLKKMPLEQVQTAVEAATDEARKAWRKNPSVAAEVLSIRSAKAKARVEKARTEGTLVELAI